MKSVENPFVPFLYHVPKTSYYKNRKLDCEYSCDLEKTLSPDRWEYCVVRTEYSDIFYSNLARIWYPTRDYMIVEYHVEEYWNGPNGI